MKKLCTKRKKLTSPIIELSLSLILALGMPIHAAQAGALSNLKGLNKDIVKLSKALSTGAAGHVVIAPDKNDFLLTTINVSDCSATLSSQHFKKSEEEGHLFLVEKELDRTANIANDSHPVAVQDAFWGHGIQLGSSLFSREAKIFFEKAKDRDKMLEKFKELHELCREKLIQLKFLSQEIMDKENERGQTCLLQSDPQYKILALAESSFVESSIAFHQLRNFKELVLRQPALFSKIDPMELSSKDAEGYLKLALEFLKPLQDYPNLIHQLPLSKLHQMVLNIHGILGYAKIPSEAISLKVKVKDKLKKIFSTTNPHLQPYLIQAGIGQELLLQERIKNGQALDLEEIISFLKREEEIASQNGDSESEAFPQVNQLSKKRLQLLAGIVKKHHPVVYKEIYEDIDVSSGTDHRQMVRDLGHVFKSSLMKHYLSKFSREHNIFQNKDIAGKDEEVERNYQNVLGLIEKYPHFIYLVDTDLMVDFVKMGVMNFGNHDEISYLMNNLLLANPEYLMARLSKDDGAQNEAVFQLFDKDAALDDETFFNMLKRENDILWLITIRNQLSSNRLSSISDGDPKIVAAAEALEKKIAGDFNFFYKSAQFRTSLLLKKFQKSQPEDWRKIIKKSLSEEQPIDFNRDFNHYGRWGIAGDTLEELIKYQTKVGEKEDLKERNRYHEILVNAVLSNVGRFSNLPRLMDFASNLSVSLPLNKSTSALQEFTQLYSDIEAERDRAHAQEEKKLQEKNKAPDKATK